MRVKLLFLLVLGQITVNVNAQTTCNTTDIFDDSYTTPPNDNKYCTEVVNNQVRYVFANAIPNHTTGTFPNAGNPNTYIPQNTTRTVCTNPVQGSQVSIYDAEDYGCFGLEFGIASNGVLFDPLAASWFTGSTGIVNQDWNLNALSSLVNLGLDTNDAHVQPNGTYHYHGDPVGLANALNITSGAHSPIIGYAADGFPIYYRYVYNNPLDSNSGIIEKTASYQLKSGSRGGDGINTPSGSYDGTYTQDYEYVASGSYPLDAANGRYGYTPDYPNGTYYYVITSNYPKIPRHFNATVDRSFTVGAPGSAGCGTTNTTSYCATVSTKGFFISKNGFSISPNPASDFVQIRLHENLENQVIRTSIIDSDGKLVLDKKGFSDNLEIHHLQKGLYFIVMNFSNGQTISKKLIKI